MELLDLSVKLDDNLSPDELIIQAELLFEVMERAKSLYSEFSSVDIHVWVEQGSVTKRTKWFLGLTTLFNVISNIDSFVGGLEKIYLYSEKVMTYITKEIISPAPYKVASVKRSAGLPQKITEVLYRVQLGKSTPEEATQRVLKLIDNEDVEASIKDSFITSFESTAQLSYRAPWIQLPMFPNEELENPLKPVPTKKNKPKVPNEELSLQGVELWYDKKTGRKVIRRYTK